MSRGSLLPAPSTRSLIDQQLVRDVALLRAEYGPLGLHLPETYAVDDEPRDLHSSTCAVWTSDGPCDCTAEPCS